MSALNDEDNQYYLLKTQGEWAEIWIALSKVYTCKRCVDPFCCTRIPVMLLPGESQRIADYLKMDFQAFLRQYTLFSKEKPYFKFPCPFYNES